MKSIIGAVAALALLTTTAMADHMSCAQISYAKHRIWNAAGLCFQDRSALRAFPNNPNTCDTYDVSEVYGRLTLRQQLVIDTLTQDARDQGCVL